MSTPGYPVFVDPNESIFYTTLNTCADKELSTTITSPMPSSFSSQASSGVLGIKPSDSSTPRDTIYEASSSRKSSVKSVQTSPNFFRVKNTNRNQSSSRGEYLRQPESICEVGKKQQGPKVIRPTSKNRTMAHSVLIFPYMPPLLKNFHEWANRQPNLINNQSSNALRTQTNIDRVIEMKKHMASSNRRRSSDVI